MNGTKNPIQSMSIWGGLIAVVMGGLSLLGVGNTPENQETVTQIIVGMVTVVSGVMAIIGRWRATKQISSKVVEKP